MRLHLLKNRVVGDRHDVLRAILVRAETATQARSLASTKAGDEGSAVWLDDRKSTVDLITTYGDERVIITDFKAG